MDPMELQLCTQEPGDRCPQLTLVNFIWWQLVSNSAALAGGILETYYAEWEEVYFKAQRSPLHLEFHNVSPYPARWGVASPGMALALLCPNLRYLNLDTRHRIVEVWLLRCTTSGETLCLELVSGSF